MYLRLSLSKYCLIGPTSTVVLFLLFVGSSHNYVARSFSTMTSYAAHAWRLVPDDSQHSVYRRPLGNTELAFYWDSVFNGTAITISRDELDADPDLEQELFSEPNVRRAWLRMKQRYPLLGATIDERDGSETVEFVVDEESLRANRRHEVSLADVDDFDGVVQIVERLLNGPSPLSKELVARLWVVKQKDVQCRYHVVTCLIHSITDGVAGNAVTREFLQELSSLSEEVDVKGIPLAERLRMLLPLEDLHPILGMSPARRKWREVTAKVILDNRLSKQTVSFICGTIRYAFLQRVLGWTLPSQETLPRKRQASAFIHSILGPPGGCLRRNYRLMPIAAYNLRQCLTRPESTCDFASTA